MKRLLSPSHISQSRCHLCPLCLCHTGLLSASEKLLSPFLPEGLCASYCSLCSRCPPLSSSFRSQLTCRLRGDFGHLFQKCCTPSQLYLPVYFLHSTASTQNYLDVNLPCPAINLSSLCSNFFHGRDLGFCLLLCP